MADIDPVVPPATPPAPDPAPTPAPATPPAAEQAVPYPRFKEVNDKYTALKQQLATLTGEKEQQTAAQQTLEQRLAALEGDLVSERTAKTRLEVANKKGIPADLAGRLQGATAEELEADADRLLAFLKPKDGPGVPPLAGGKPTRTFDLAGKTPAEIRKARAEGKI